MSENVLVNFRLDKDQPVRLRWLASDGTPGDGYKAQVTAIRLSSGATLVMDSSAIVEQTAPDPDGGRGAYLVTFNGMVGFAVDHPERAIVEKLQQEDIDYDLEFIHDDSGRVAIEGTDYTIIERPRGLARNVRKSTTEL